MMSDLSIVYPDANQHTLDLMTGECLARLREAGQFTAHSGRPENDRQFIARIGDANALMLGWRLPNYRGEPTNVVAAPSRTGPLRG